MMADLLQPLISALPSFGRLRQIHLRLHWFLTLASAATAFGNALSPAKPAKT
jgi:hypothetical protein